MEISCNSVSGKLPCPCGDSSHARFSYDNIYSLCHRVDHPTDPNAFPDQAYGTLVPEILTGTTNDVPFVDDKPLIIDEPPLPDLKALEDSLSHCKEGPRFSMDMDAELTAPANPPHFPPCGQPDASAPLNEHPSLIEKVSCTGRFPFGSLFLSFSKPNT